MVFGGLESDEWRMALIKEFSSDFDISLIFISFVNNWSKHVVFFEGSVQEFSNMKPHHQSVQYLLKDASRTE